MNDEWLGKCYAVLGDSALRGAVLLLTGAFAARLCRKATAASRHVIWIAALAACLCLPLLIAFAPGILVLPAVAPATKVASQRPQAAPASVNSQDSLPVTSSDSYVLPNEAQVTIDRAKIVGPVTILFFVWCLGAALLISRMVVGTALLRRLPQRAIPFACETGDWTGAGGNPRAEMLLAPSDGPAAPITWGWLRPVILLPSDADTWPSERVRWALAHEMAHIARRDWLWLMVGELACALYWINPLAWLALRRMREEGELAADDRVLAAGANPSEYAAMLLEVARTMKSRSYRPIAAASLAPRASIEGRIRAILDMSRERGTAAPKLLMTTFIIASILLGATGLIRSASSARPAPQQGAGTVSCKSNLKQVALALLMYVQDYDEITPPMRSQPQTQALLMPYIKNASLFSCPDTHLPYALNSMLSRKPVRWIKAPVGDVVAFVDAKPFDGVWNTAFLDGRVRELTSAPNLSAPIEMRPLPKAVKRAMTSAQKLRMIARLRAERKKIDMRIRAIQRGDEKVQYMQSMGAATLGGRIIRPQ